MSPQAEIESLSPGVPWEYFVTRIGERCLTLKKIPLCKRSKLVTRLYSHLVVIKCPEPKPQVLIVRTGTSMLAEYSVRNYFRWKSFVCFSQSLLVRKDSEIFWTSWSLKTMVTKVLFWPDHQWVIWRCSVTSFLIWSMLKCAVWLLLELSVDIRNGGLS